LSIRNLSDRRFVARGPGWLGPRAAYFQRTLAYVRLQCVHHHCQNRNANTALLIRNRDSKDRQSQRRAPGVTRVIADGVLHEKAFISDEMPQPTRVDSTIWGQCLLPNAAITLSSIAIGVGKARTSTVVRVGFGLAGPAKYSA